MLKPGSNALSHKGRSSFWLMNRLLLFAALLTSSWTTLHAAEATADVPFNFILGTQAIGGRYHFTQDAPLLESARIIAELGSGIMKFSISRQALFGKTKANVTNPDPSLKTLTDVASREPAHRAVLDMPFTHFFIWAYPFTSHGSAAQFKPAERDLEYREMYDFSCHLLRTYNGTGKSFYLGHWEGDWHLRPHFDPKQGFSETDAGNFITWLKVRQQAIDDAKRDTVHQGVWLWHYTEANLVTPYLKGGQCLTNDILPKVDIDYVSYSCYDSIQHDIHEGLFQALDHIESKLQPRPGITGKRVFIGEYGFPSRRYTPEEQNRKSIEAMIAALEWGCPFALYWELYDNEGTPEKPGGFWLINEKNEKQPVWETHRRFFEWARQHVADARKKSGVPPTPEAFRKSAVEWLKTL
jgi:hypothetical protein